MVPAVRRVRSSRQKVSYSGGKKTISLPSEKPKFPVPTSVTKSLPSLSKPQPNGSGCSASPSLSGSAIFFTSIPSGEKMPQPTRISGCPVSSPMRRLPLPSGSRQTWPLTVFRSAGISTVARPVTRPLTISYTSSWLSCGAYSRSVSHPGAPAMQNAQTPARRRPRSAASSMLVALWAPKPEPTNTSPSTMTA